MDGAVQPRERICVVIPALNEERAIGGVLEAIPEWVNSVIVADNGSRDGTAAAARAGGAMVVHEPRRGYGAACLAALAEVNHVGCGDARAADIIVFMDGDGSDDPAQMADLVEPIVRGEAKLVIGSRVLGEAEPGALTLPQRFGNTIACALLRGIWRVRCTDLGPFRAVRFSTLKRLAMSDLDYGWTVQMQARAARLGTAMTEVPVRYRRRVGVSKISGTVRGVVGAGVKILGTIMREAVAGPMLDRARPGLTVFTRLPVAGRAKTRLIPALGAEGAADLQRRMTLHTLRIAHQWRSGRGGRIEVRYTGGSPEQMRATFGSGPRYVQQGEGDLGHRLARALEEGFRDGCRPIIAVGSDCPELDETIITRAVEAMYEHDVVIGPATDGGYYLIGLREPQPALFREIEWGTERVLEQTQRLCAQRGLRVAYLKALSDVDEPADLDVWQRVQAIGADDQHDQDHQRAWPPGLSIIIPTLNEADHLERAIGSIGQGDDVEIIVIDGGSADGTLDLARNLGARVITSKTGRAAQMNAGAAAARGDVLLFLHADTRLPFAYRAEVDRIMAMRGVAAGAFRLAFDELRPSLRAIEIAANLRSRFLGMPYGDQAIFIRRAKFEEIGGYGDLPVMEDFDLVRRLRRRGRIVVAEPAAVTSARKWRRRGPWRTTWAHQVAIISYLCGRPPERIAEKLQQPPRER